MPAVTILLPVYNAERYLAECLESILNQTFQDFELLIISDGSSDRSVEIIQTYDDERIRLVHNSVNRGITYTLNRGIELALAPLIARMDADDVMLPNRLEVQVGYLKAHPEVSGVSSYFTTIDAQGKKTNLETNIKTDNTYISWCILFSNPFAHPTVTIRTKLVRAVGGYGANESYVEDFYLWCTLYAEHTMHIIPKALILYRTHSNSICHLNRLKQNFNAGKIVQNNLAGFLSIPISEVDFVQSGILFHSFQGHLAVFEDEKIKKALELLEKVYWHYLQTQKPTQEALQEIQSDIKRILHFALLSASTSARVAIIRDSTFVRTFMDARLFLSVMHNWKALAKTLLGKTVVRIPVIKSEEELLLLSTS